MSPASDPLLFIGSLLHSCVLPPSVLSNGDKKGDCRRIYLNNTKGLNDGSDNFVQKNISKILDQWRILTCSIIYGDTYS